MPALKTVLSGLTTYVVSEIPADVKPDGVVVLCHGYGASGRDLLGLTQALEMTSPGSLRRFAFLHPEAPIDLADVGIPFGRAWWPVDLDRLINRPTADLLMRFRREEPLGMSEARAAFSEMLAQASQSLGVGVERFVLGGFSQGAMLATDAALRMKNGPAALCILSGALTNETEWRKLAANRPPMTVLQTHGRQDQILMYPQATALRDLLADAGHNVEFVPFEGGHEIPPPAVERVADLLDRLFKK